MKIKKLFAVADDAKNVGDYESANKIWAFLFEGAFRSNHCSVRFEYETDGGDPHYDLAVLVLEGPVIEGHVVDERRLCIPVPLLSTGAVARFFRDGRVKNMDREVHNRERRPVTLGYKKVVGKIGHRVSKDILKEDEVSSLFLKKDLERIDIDTLITERAISKPLMNGGIVHRYSDDKGVQWLVTYQKGLGVKGLY